MLLTVPRAPGDICASVIQLQKTVKQSETKKRCTVFVLYYGYIYNHNQSQWKKFLPNALIWLIPTIVVSGLRKLRA